MKTRYMSGQNCKMSKPKKRNEKSSMYMYAFHAQVKTGRSLFG
jgi:hypothetical protein